MSRGVVRRATGGAGPGSVEGTIESAGSGGSAAGFVVRESTGIRFTGNTAEGLAGGLGSFLAPRGPTWGFHVDPETFDLLIDDSNTVDGEALFVADGIDDLTVEGLELGAGPPVSNLGRIALRRCRNVTVRGNHVVGASGGNGESTAYRPEAEPGEAAAVPPAAASGSMGPAEEDEEAEDDGGVHKLLDLDEPGVHEHLHEAGLVPDATRLLQLVRVPPRERDWRGKLDFNVGTILSTEHAPVETAALD